MRIGYIALQYVPYLLSILIPIYFFVQLALIPIRNKLLR